MWRGAVEGRGGGGGGGGERREEEGCFTFSFETLYIRSLGNVPVVFHAKQGVPPPDDEEGRAR